MFAIRIFVRVCVFFCLLNFFAGFAIIAIAMFAFVDGGRIALFTQVAVNAVCAVVAILTTGTHVALTGFPFLLEESVVAHFKSP